MKTYFRILSYARPLGRFVAPYTLFSLLSSVFGIMNFTLIQPLLEVLFNQVGTNAATLQKPEPSFDVSYLTHLFNYTFASLAQEKGKMAALQFVCGTIVVSVLLSNIFRYFSVRTIEKVKAHTIASLRQAVFEKTVRLHLGFFTNERKGNIMAYLTTDVQEIENSVGRAFTALFKELFTLVMFFVFLFRISWNLTLFTLVLIPISGLIIGWMSRKLKENAHQVQSRLSNLTSLLDEVFGGMRIVKAFNAEKVMSERFRSENFGYKAAILKLYSRVELASPLSEFMGVVSVSVLLLYGGSLVFSHQSSLTASMFVTYIILFSQVLRPAKEISNAISSLQRGIAAAERIVGLLDTEEAVKNQTGAKSLAGFKQELRFQDVNFEYEAGNPVLKNVNFVLPKGKTLALVGSSGGGKSTIADLIPRFYDPTSGQIQIDGVDIRAYTKQSVRDLLGIVTQESILFNDTIFNNIAFGMEATLEQVIEAAKIANAHEFITETPKGYQTKIGDRGTKLSGGQRQRLSIARAVLKNPPILILDEATSALDTESEKLVQEALTNLMQNRTTLVIAHRLSTIQKADEILVMHHGEVIEQGTHDDLLQVENGFYRRLNYLQQT
ncbi:MAG: ABC transporter ATP-binding protein [Spirosomataceae bacterium]